MATSPRAAVVIPTYRRSARARQLIRWLLAEQTVTDFELVVVDDGSGDDTAAVLTRLRREDRTGRLTILSTGRNSGPARARNLGWRHTSAPVVAFTDDDCLPRATWLAKLLEQVAAGADVVQGRTVPDPAVWGSHGAFFRTVDTAAMNTRFQTCNIAYRRELLERLDGFDEGFTGVTLGEDMDLGLRALGLGARLAFEPEAVVVHEVVDGDVLGWLGERRRRASLPYLISRHPRLRDRLVWGVFCAPEHARALAGTVGLLLSLPAWPLARIWGLWLLGEYVRFRLREQPIHGKRRHRVWAVPTMMLGEAFEALVVGWNSLRRGDGLVL